MMRIMQGREAPKPIYFFFFACSVISHKERSLRTRRGRKWSLARRLGRTRRTATREKEAQTKKKKKTVFLTTSLDSAARSSSYNGGQQQERGTVDMDKRASLSRSFSPQFGVGSKGEKPIAAVGASESKRWITREILRSLFLSSLSPRSVL